MGLGAKINNAKAIADGEGSNPSSPVQQMISHLGERFSPSRIDILLPIRGHAVKESGLDLSRWTGIQSWAARPSGAAAQARPGTILCDGELARVSERPFTLYQP
jgi:hypothetical protein